MEQQPGKSPSPLGWVYNHVTMLMGLAWVSVLCHFQYLIRGNYMALADFSRDGGSQYLIYKPFLARQIESGAGVWSFDYGLGGDVFSAMAYYYSTSPFFYLELLLKNLFGADWSTLEGLLQWKPYFSILMQWLAMAAMYLLLVRERHPKWLAFVGAGCYGASFWFMKHSNDQEFMLPAMVLLPLVVWGIRRYQEQKKPAVLVVSVALVLINNFYLGYGCAVFCLLFLVFVNPEGWRPVQKGLLHVARFIPWVALAFGLAAIGFGPAVQAFFGADRASNDAHLALLPPGQRLFTLDDWFFLIPLGLPLVLMCVPVALRLEQDRLRRGRLWFAVLLGILSVVPILSGVFSAFQGESHRWYYMVSFAGAYALPVVVENLLRRRASLAWAGGMGAILLAFVATRSLRGCWDMTGKGNLIGILAVLSVVCLWFGNHIATEKGILPDRPTRGRLYKAVLAALILLPMIGIPIEYYGAGALWSNDTPLPADRFPNVDARRQAQLNELQADIEKGTFWRIDDPAINEATSMSETGVNWQVDYENRNNLPMLYGYYGTSSYNSLITKNVHHWLKAEHHVRQSMQAPSIYYGLDNRRFLQTLWSVRYVADSGTGTVTELPHQVGPDLWYETRLPEQEAASLDDAQSDAALLQAATLSEESQLPETSVAALTDVTTPILDGDLSTARLTDVTVEGDQWTFGHEGEINIPLSAPAGEGEYLVTIELERTNERQWDNPERFDELLYDFNLSVNGKQMAVIRKDYQWYYSVDRYVVCLAGDATNLQIRLTQGTYRVDRFRVDFNSYEALPTWVAARNKYNLTDLTMKGDRITGTLTNEEQGVLALSVPYEEGWRIYDGGREVPAQKVNGVLLGVELAPGTHQLEFRYQVPHMKLFAAISGLSLVLFAALLAAQRKSRNENDGRQEP